jgi:hypothetical protein
MKNEDALFVQANGTLKATRIGIAAAGNDCDTHESGLATVIYGTAHRDSWTLMLAKSAHRARYHQVNHTVVSRVSGGNGGGNPIRWSRPQHFRFGRCQAIQATSLPHHVRKSHREIERITRFDCKSIHTYNQQPDDEQENSPTCW